MRLTTLSDYAFRVLMYAAAAGDRLITIEETAKTYNVSRAHLMKVVNILTRTGYLKGVRGRAGGVTLAIPPRPSTSELSYVRPNQTLPSSNVSPPEVSALSRDAASCPRP